MRLHSQVTSLRSVLAIKFKNIHNINIPLITLY